MNLNHYRSAAALGAVPLAFVVACAGVASAAPTQPGVTNEAPSVQSVQRESAPAKPKQVVERRPDPDPTPTPAPVAVPDPPRTVPSRVAPATTTPAPTIFDSTLHAPEAVEPVAPIAAPPNKMRLGDFETDKPEWVSTEVMNSANNWSAYGESEIARGWNSVGVSPARSDRVAATTTAGAVIGGTIGATAAGIPAATAGAVSGAVIGAGVGAAVGCAVLVPIPVICAQAVPGALIGAGVGAVAGAGLVGIPAAALGGASGALAGGAIGTAYGAGDPDAATAVPEIQVAAPALPQVDARHHRVGRGDHGRADRPVGRDPARRLRRDRAAPSLRSGPRPGSRTSPVHPMPSTRSNMSPTRSSRPQLPIPPPPTWSTPRSRPRANCRRRSLRSSMPRRSRCTPEMSSDVRHLAGPGAPQHLVSAVRAAPGGDTDASRPAGPHPEGGGTDDGASDGAAPDCADQLGATGNAEHDGRARHAEHDGSASHADPHGRARRRPDRHGRGPPDAGQNGTDAGNPAAVADRQHPERRDAASTDPHTSGRRPDRDRRWWGRRLRHEFGARDGEPTRPQHRCLPLCSRGARRRTTAIRSPVTDPADSRTGRRRSSPSTTPTTSYAAASKPARWWPPTRRRCLARQVIQAAIDSAIPPGTEHCLAIVADPIEVERYWVTLSERRPDSAQETYQQIVTTADQGGRHVITSIGAAE